MHTDLILSNYIPPDHQWSHLLLLRSIKLPHGNQLSNNAILFIKPLLPPLQRLNLIRRQVRQRIQRAIEVLGEHILIKATARKPAAGIAASKVGIRAPGTVKVAPARHVKHFAADGEVHGVAVFAVERQQRARRVGLEDDGRRGLGHLVAGGRAEEEAVAGVEDGADEEEVEGREEGVAASRSVSLLPRSGALGMGEAGSLVAFTWLGPLRPLGPCAARRNPWLSARSGRMYEDMSRAMGGDAGKLMGVQWPEVEAQRCVAKDNLIRLGRSVDADWWGRYPRAVPGKTSGQWVHCRRNVSHKLQYENRRIIES